MLQDKKLLVCIAFHYSQERERYLKQVIEELQNYKIQLDIVIDTNSQKAYELDFLKKENVSIILHENLDHPYHLTCRHKSHILKSKNDYDWFMYMEDDMVLPYFNFYKFTEKFECLWPNYTPGFIRVERYEDTGNEEFCNDIMIDITNDMVIDIDGKNYVDMPYHYNYHAFWILPKKALEDCIEKIGESNFLNVPDQNMPREYSSSFVIWVLKVKCLLSIDENSQLDRSCISYHVANNYRHSAKKLSDIWKVCIQSD
jgi:hypothetical protein